LQPIFKHNILTQLFRKKNSLPAEQGAVKMKTMTCKNIFAILLFLPLFLFSQYSKKEIENFNRKISQLRKEGKFGDALILYKKFIEDNKDGGNQQELLHAYVQTANVLSNLSRAKESIEYLELAEKGNQDLHNTEIEAKILGEYGRNYYALGFTQKAIEYYTKSIDLSENIKDEKSKVALLQYLYGLRSSIYEENKQFNNLYIDLHDSYKINPDTYSASRLAKYFTVHRKNLDSAQFYLKKGEELFNAGKLPVFQKSILLRNYGRYYFEKKDYDKAISYYTQSLEISEYLKKPKDILDTNKLLYEVYKANKDNENAGKSLEKYSKINDSLSLEHKKIQETPVKQILREKDKVVKKEKTYLYLIIIVLIIILFLSYFILRRISKSNREEKLEIISKNEIQTQELKLKINESFEEVIQLAKDNSVEFFTRFKEVYPEFIAQLLKIDPKFRVSELTLLAYFYLGFNSKDIATYTFKSVNTVRSRKYNLRKKLGILPEENMELWLKNLV
jgi:tetratricopeptide (TPR) repeat protein